MKGLLLKDLYMTVKYCRAYFFIAIVFALASVWGNSWFFLAYPIIMASVIPVNLISYDEKSKWSVYVGTFPYSKKEIVSVKYIITLIFLGLAILLSGITQTVHMLIQGTFDLEFLIVLLVLLPVVGVICPNFMLPAIFKYGVEKGRLVFYGVMIFLCALLAVLGAIGSVNDGLPGLFPSLQLWIVPLILGIGVVLLISSWLLSIRFYSTKEG